MSAGHPSPGSRASGRGAQWFLVALGALVVGGFAFLMISELREGASSLETAPDFTAERLEGGTLTLSSLRGHVVMLDFWATWCGPCRMEMPSLARLAGEYQGKGVVFVAADQIDADDAGQVQAFLAAFPRPENMHPVLAGNPVFDQYKVSALPTLFLIGPDGRVLSAHRGAYSERSIRSWLDDALSSGKP